ncbi:hypothetical protein QWY99_22085 [Flavobacterium branchiarum]|uniref:Uncharacterized protein n=1 Tax=Flavobacterium branchiarum TaxID=1114870 RepID=A0ABV5FSN1_9FLAO|nr:hypothetical protein [Flavobacterium branchiarum]MDN3672629.1 hypothetical protein [Flavobacterium branchiarum]MDN3675727.1 hypothetical protein [Flavobacterium branchiarum]
MITIFNYNPTDQELSDIRFDAFSLCQKFGIDTDKELTPELYLNLVSQENAYYDLAVLFEFRKDQKKADEFWAKLPKELQSGGLGYDCLNIAI